jgi:hypothetical protein
VIVDPRTLGADELEPAARALRAAVSAPEPETVVDAGSYE